MKFLVVLSVALLVTGCVAQTNDRRGRLKSLISAARTGNPDARRTLQSLRSQLRQRKVAEAQTPQSTIAPTTFQPAFVEPEVLPQQETIPSFPVFEAVVEPSPAPLPQNPRPTRFRQPIEQDNFINTRNQPHRTLHNALEVDDRSEVNVDIRVTNLTKTPPIETIRRYSYFNDAGDYIFGYETADGSFKEEKRGRDCIVNGKYGYVDPDGVKREFTYVSGNRCDPNAEEPLLNLQGHPIDPATVSQQSLSPNKQFHAQTASEQLTPEAIVERTFNRRRRPVAERRRVQEAVQEVPRAFVRKPDPTPAPAKIEPEFINTPAPGPATQPPTTKAPVVFRPTIATTLKPRRPQVNFDFDREFQNIFDNFSNRPSGNIRPRPATRPAPRPVPTAAPTRPSTPKETKAPTQKPKPTVMVDLSSSKPARPSSGHQLVFDASTGTFKTVPLSNLVNTAALPTGRALPLFTSPLPSVPTGSLSFGNTATSAKDFNNFFNQFSVRPVV